MLRRVAGACGITSQLVGLVVILVVISNSPWFRWTEYDISVLGVEGSATALFNWGLILTGLLSLVFTIGLWKSLIISRVGRFGVASLLLGSISISLVGIFPRTADLPHDSASIAFFILITLALLLVGVAAIVAGRRVFGVLSIVGGILIVVILRAPWPWSGGTIEQLLSCLPWSLWTVILGIRMLGSLPMSFVS